ncbi:Ig-like and fibronectin type-III domain-containing protein 1 [Wyeomyia smithii]|uniref:Ig-like and fibronectin type-III domain-containing protein 1 n=1 Tax=Wyeomyia smithii TaxID=174621 RepID=UPI002467E064|nr:Ig-like and fibronectin type-III domain-containing protein 1 [Wyeomyia smithii]XP_055528946.1 Ig-like and fibronectin type-III domain-containing protein 1 [Wyeomyia smithii]XP_055528947.1 Ig-like and fibronectin type-III domain-containing protein 1 [Wyeomyia smithii]XP_055528948.1 Ig-like and fibronectin type-III domain-containing protein 1 [Wyeomyia smithii]XP_055528949.1 Ig-like and fibronectin type-III domain-containing protein 1 [Wyeomyia smithii]
MWRFFRNIRVPSKQQSPLGTAPGLLLITAILLLDAGRHNVAVVAVDPVGTGGPSVVHEGEDALLTCVVMTPYNNDTVLWRKGPNEILSAGMNRVTSDKRISILHDDSPNGRTPLGGDVWVLLIKDARLNDTDVYVCEVNSDPVVRSFHPLRVKKSKKAGTTESSSTSESSTSGDKTNAEELSDEEEDAEVSPDEVAAPRVSHDFTGCCKSTNVSEACLGFCVLHNILEGNTGVEPEQCEKDFPNIVKCMADGRNHVPCCVGKGIPDLCQDMCRGEYTPFTDLLKSRVSCVQHTLPGLQCILDNIQRLPSEPQSVAVEALTERSLQVSWSPPERLAKTVKYYQINATKLHSFDQDFLANATKDSMLSIQVSSDQGSVIVSDLDPFTMYTITVSAHNDFGSSLPSIKIRALTLENGGGNKQTSVAVVPILPDVRGCCIKNGVTHRTCLDKMCDPVKADFTEVPDLMVCAPWANITFGCLANKIDHTSCCKSRGIPDGCLTFCSGTVKAINFNYFKCLQYMSDYSSCLLQGYGVLSGPPSKLKAPLIASHFVVLEWKPPKILPDTVTSYHLHYRRLGSGEEYSVVEKDQPPVILEDLEAAQYYEAFVVAANAHGKGGPSPRLVFQTKRENQAEPIIPTYNISSCCHASGILPQCAPLCSYDVKMSDLQKLGNTCRGQIGTIVRCSAGGRDHSSCCERRAVPPKCRSLCRGVITQSPSDCLPYAGNIIQCFEEGIGHIPAPVEDLHVTSVSNTSISLAWVPSEVDPNNTDTQATDYLVQYGKVNNMTMYETIIKLENEVNTTETEMELTNLEPKGLYRITVIARGLHGSSLPSSMLLINTSRTDAASTVYGAPSPPHSISVSSHSATWITVAWQPPEFSHPHETITYRVIHKVANNFTVIDTRLLWVRISNLQPNTQHIVYVVALGAKGTSLPSETLVAWTDPALPAFVDPPTVHPSDIISEGGSMTILCLALGNPAPTISLYVGGHLVRQDTSRHMITVIHNVTTDMEHISCYADNGYGIPMQASKKVNISFAPRIQASGITIASVGESVDLKCTVRARPIPKTMFWRDHDGRVPVIQGGNFGMAMRNDVDDNSLYTMTLTISKLTAQEVGEYFCHAENALGSSTRAVSVRIRNTAAFANVSECCVSQNVSSACMSACSFYIDIESVIDRPECLVDFDKLMKCAADGSDHRGCCASKDLPRRCLNWCRGEPINPPGICALQHTRTIVGCFQENRDRLPGPPQNLQVQVLNDEEVLIKWDPPSKNPHTVEGYRLFWHDMEPVTENFSNVISGLGTSRLDAKETSIKLEGLKPNVMYELVIKAGNHFGASILSDPLRFTLGDHHITSASQSSNAGVISGIIGGILAIILAISALVIMKKRKIGQKQANGGVAFENPSYLREMNVEHVQIPAVSGQSTTDWRQESLHSANGTATTGLGQDNSVVPMATEVNPSLYEELKLGHDRAGFKRLVS